MKIRSIAVNQFMKYSEPKQLTGLTNGLNLVVGPNEMGKSTLLCALKAAFFDRYSSKAKRIKGFQHHRNRAAPVVQVQFELDNGKYSVTKRFLKRTYAKLTCPDSTIVEGDAVEEELNKLLRAGEGHYSPFAADAPGMWDVIWVEQGNSFNAPDPSDDARSALYRVLESEVDFVLGGKRGQELPARFEAELNEFITPKTKKPKGKYKLICEKVDRLRETIEDLKIRKSELSKDFEQLERDQSQLTELERGELDSEDSEALEKAQEERIELEKYKETIRSVKANCARLESELKLLEADKEKFTKLVDSIENESTQVSKFEQELTDLRGKCVTLEAKCSELRERLQISRDTSNQAIEARRRAQLVLDAVRKNQEVSTTCSIFKAALEAYKRYQNDRQAAAEILVTENEINRIRTAAQRYAAAKSTLKANATEVSFFIKEGRTDRVKLDGQPLQNRKSSIEAVERTVVSVSEIGEIRIKPGIQNVDDLLAKQENAKQKLNWELKKVHTQSLQQAEQLFGKRQSLLESAKFAFGEHQRVLKSSKHPFTNIQDLELYAIELKADLETTKKELKIDVLPSLEKAIQVIDRAEEKVERTLQENEGVQNRLNVRQEQVNKLRNEVTRVETQFEQCRRLLIQHQNELEKLESNTPLSNVKKKIEDTKLELSHQKEGLQILVAKDDPLRLRRLIQRIERIRRRIRQRRQQKQKLRDSITRLTTKLETDEARGLHEKLAESEREFSFVSAKKNAYDRNIQVLELLLSTLKDAEQKAKEKFLQPILSRVNPYLRHLFPDSEIKIDENLKIVDIVRDKEQEKFDQLSMGTQEQIAVLIRLALAELLADKGIPATVVLDDALVYSDDVRMDLMFYILTEAAKKNQIIVLTCREKVFQGLTDSVLSLEDGDIEELRSA